MSCSAPGCGQAAATAEEYERLMQMQPLLACTSKGTATGMVSLQQRSIGQDCRHGESIRCSMIATFMLVVDMREHIGRRRHLQQVVTIHCSDECSAAGIYTSRSSGQYIPRVKAPCKACRSHQLSCHYICIHEEHGASMHRCLSGVCMMGQNQQAHFACLP